jgi:GNAT superfamily N-acetyltransferase
LSHRISFAHNGYGYNQKGRPRRPRSRGAGIGKALFRKAIDWGREKGCHNLTLHVWEANPGAQAFYEALGLKPQYTSMEMILD